MSGRKQCLVASVDRNGISKRKEIRAKTANIFIFRHACVGLYIHFVAGSGISSTCTGISPENVAENVGENVIFDATRLHERRFFAEIVSSSVMAAGHS